LSAERWNEPEDQRSGFDQRPLPEKPEFSQDGRFVLTSSQMSRNDGKALFSRTAAMTSSGSLIMRGRLV
jgi:hypothetical protein